METLGILHEHLKAIGEAMHKEQSDDTVQDAVTK